MENKLHMVESFGNELCYRDKSYDKVPIHWIVVRRNRERMRLYEVVLANYLGWLDLEDMVPTVSDVRTYFTHVEAEIFREYVTNQFGWPVVITPIDRVFSLQEFDPTKVYPYLGKWQLTYLNVFKNGNYTLDFCVSGCCEWSQAEQHTEQITKIASGS